MSKRRDLAGRQFGMITVLSYSHTISGRAQWLCECQCGNRKVIPAEHLRDGVKSSCGCVPINRTHGMRGTRIYTIWKNIRARCTNTKERGYANYAGRGIRLCERWYKFENFYSDMGDPPTPKHSIDRINNNGNYEPGNCRWATPTEQARNRRNSVIVEHNGISMTCAEWDQSRGFPQGTIARRIRKGWSVNDAVETRAPNKKELAVA